jgi:RNA polymerase sigma factor (sigma-70 family)
MDEDERRARLEALYATHAGRVLRYAQRRTDQATAADVLSEVFVVAWRRLDDVPTTDPLPWLLACARRVVWHQQRSERRRSKLVERLTANTPGTPLSVELHDRALAQAFAMLSERDREALLLTAWEGLTANEAARMLGCSPQAYRVRAHRARKRLAAALLDADARSTPLTMEACNE